MDTAQRFQPPRTAGSLFQGLLALLALAGGFWLLNLAAVTPVGPRLALDLLGGLLLLGLAGLFLYGFYALQRSEYLIHRDGLQLRWGWREVHLPMPEVLSAYLNEGLERPAPLPRLRWPGWLLGRRRAPWGTIEYLAADPHRLVLVETPHRWYALSPEDPAAFLEALRLAAEAGSLNPLPPYTRHPLDIFGELRTDRWAQGLLLTAWLSGMALLLTALLSTGRIPRNATVTSWLLLPVVNFLFLGAGLGMGFFAYRSSRRRALAYPVWLSNSLASLSLLLFTLFFLFFS